MSICDQCDGSGYILVQVDGRTGAKECECRAVLKLEKMLERCGLPARYQQASFETFDAKGVDKRICRAKILAEGYCDEFLSNPAGGLLFVGPVGTGKTHLAIAILRKLTLNYSTRTYFTDFRDLLKRMQATFDGGVHVTRAEILKPVLEAEALVIDELGAARVTDWTYEVAEEIINARYNSARATIFTTNLGNFASSAEATVTPIDTSKSRYSAIAAESAMRIETLGDRLGARMFSRLQEMCQPIEIAGEDYRRRRRA